MLPEDAAMIRAIMEPYTLPVGSVARLKPGAVMELMERGELVENAEDEDEVWNQRVEVEAEDDDDDLAPAPVKMTPSELRKDVAFSLRKQGFKIAEIEAACNAVSWSRGESLDQMLQAVMVVLRPPDLRPPDPPKPSKHARIYDADWRPESTTPAPADPIEVILPPTIPQWVRAVTK
jgi:ribonuclease D